MKGLPHLGCSAAAPIVSYLTLLFISVKSFSISTLKHILNLLSFFFLLCLFSFLFLAGWGASLGSAITLDFKEKKKKPSQQPEVKENIFSFLT